MSKAYQPEGLSLSRRGLLRGASLAAGGGVLAWAGLAQTATAQVNKVSQKQVHYQMKPKGNAQCSKCTHFQPPSSCAVVAGKISPNGWCSMFAPKL